MNATKGAGSTVVRRQLGRRLRRLREAAGKSHDDVTAAQIASRSKMWKIESGRVAVKQGDVLALTRLYGTDNAIVDELLNMALSSQDEGFWEDYSSSMPEWVGMFAGLEASAAGLCDYNPELLHGLLQTADYARAITAANRDLASDVVEQRVEFRLQRQRAFLERPQPGQLTAVLTAGALGLRVGSEAVMEAQIVHLRSLNKRDEVSVRVLSAHDGVHPGMRGAFTIMDFDDPEDPPLVYIESLIGSQYVERKDHLAQFRRAFAQMHDLAVPLEEYL